jgi:hypothetical protein
LALKLLMILPLVGHNQLPGSAFATVAGLFLLPVAGAEVFSLLEAGAGGL